MTNSIQWCAACRAPIVADGAILCHSCERAGAIWRTLATGRCPTCGGFGVLSDDPAHQYDIGAPGTPEPTQPCPTCQLTQTLGDWETV